MILFNSVKQEMEMCMHKCMHALEGFTCVFTKGNYLKGSIIYLLASRAYVSYVKLVFKFHNVIFCAFDF